MSHTEHPTILVAGATGAQGGAVIKSLLKCCDDHKYTIRALTRDANSSSAKKLRQSYSPIELVQGNANDPSTLNEAFQGVDYAFLVSSFWDPEQKQKEDCDFMQGKNLVDAAIKHGVKFLVWSSLYDADSMCKSAHVDCTVPHFTFKHKVEQYIMSRNIPAAFVYPGYYADNWQRFPDTAPERQPDGSLLWKCAVRADVGLPIIDTQEDFGKFVAPMFCKPERFHGARVLAAKEYLTAPQLAQIYTKATGEPIRIEKCDADSIQIEELRNQTKYFNAVGYYNGEVLSNSWDVFEHRDLKLNSFADWIERTGYRVPALEAGGGRH